MITETNKNQQQYRFFWIMYDFLLGCFGIIATLTASKAFPHKYVTNKQINEYKQSGTLHQKAIVTQSEMIEHSFYQLINLCQAMYLHTMWYIVHHQQNDATTTENSMILGMVVPATTPIIIRRMVLLWLVTSPWYFRKLVPVHSFSHNWKLYNEKQQEEEERQKKQLQSNNNGKTNINSSKIDEDTQHQQQKHQMEVIMYKIKKGQYIFYKHCILHGVNISVALNDESLQEIPYSKSWRTFWILLNSSYVMEFFLQTLVKRHIIQQSTMLLYNRILMLSSSLGAIVVLKYVPIYVVTISIVLNFVHRGHDIINTLLVASLTYCYWNHDKI